MARKKTTMGMQHWVTLLATVFVVGGVVAIVQLSPEVEETGEGGLMASEATLSGRVVVYADHGAVRVVDAAEGVELRECPVSDATRIQSVTRDGVVVGAVSGDRVRIGFDCIAGEASGAVRVQESDDAAASTLVLADGTEVTLLAENGRPFREAQIVGWMDEVHVGVVAFRGDVRYALAVGRDGAITVLTELPELVGGFAAGDSAVWYVSATPGPGIELGPQGPSAVHRVGLDGEDVRLAREAATVIEALSVGPDGAYAYIVGGALMVGRGEHVVNAGVGIPIGWTDDGRVLVVNRNRALSFKAMDGTATETGIVLPQGVSEAWSILLDGEEETK